MVVRVTKLSDRGYEFPDPERALESPNGLLAVGGDLEPQRLISAYAGGVFPWFDDDAQPILWWSPDPRAVLRPDGVRVTRSLRKRLRQGTLRCTADRAFRSVVEGCAGARRDKSGRNSGTWITPKMKLAYARLHELGYAHSIECWAGDELVGGLYGVSLGRVFFGESMFSRVTDASKVAFVRLAEQLRAWRFTLIDCQVMNPHLASLGALPMPRRTFLDLLRTNRLGDTRSGPWRLEDET